MASKKKEIEVATNHPLEQVFDIEEGSTMLPKTIVDGETLKPNDYDDKDYEIDNQFQEVYNLALTAFEEQQEAAEIIDPKYKARTSEVAAQYLATALNAANSKMQLKSMREKLELSKARLGKADALNNGQVLTDRNAILRMLRGEENETIEGEFDETDETE